MVQYNYNNEVRNTKHDLAQPDKLYASSHSKGLSTCKPSQRDNLTFRQSTYFGGPVRGSLASMPKCQNPSCWTHQSQRIPESRRGRTLHENRRSDILYLARTTGEDIHDSHLRLRRRKWMNNSTSLYYTKLTINRRRNGYRSCAPCVRVA